METGYDMIVSEHHFSNALLRPIFLKFQVRLVSLWLIASTVKKIASASVAEIGAYVILENVWIS